MTKALCRLVTLLGTVPIAACTRKVAPPEPKPSASLAVLAPSSSAGTEAIASSVSPALTAALQAWQRATNAGDAETLKSVYAEQPSLYGRIVSRAEAVRRKVAFVRDNEGFRQTMSDVKWAPDRDGFVARFRKTTILKTQPERTVDAFVLWRNEKNEWRIADEGDVQTAAKIRATLDTFREKWKVRPFECPPCSDPNYPDEPPEALPPLGPATVKSSVPSPPGAPETIEYARTILDRFASAVDVPLFMRATARSGNGDGRWFYYDLPGPDAGAKTHVIICTLGGHFHDGQLKGEPDPGHAGKPLVTFTTKSTRGKKELYYERTIYAEDGVYNFVNCSYSPEYEAYFTPIVHRMGLSLRAISGGQAERAERTSVPYLGR
jgi:hypothetical protein